MHLLRELEKVDKRDRSDTRQAFAKKLPRLVRDGIHLRKRADFTPDAYRSRIQCLDRRLIEMAEQTHDDSDAKRPAKRLGKYRDSIFTFPDYENVPFENNHAERQIRPAVVLRKNSRSNRSERGAANVDLRNNYWGTSDPDSIAAMIRDGNDDPTIKQTVQFEPFSPVPLDTEKKSLGGFKAFFR